MDYKKRYKKALEIAKDNYEAADSAAINVNSFKNTLTAIFPELKESEDERIRKKLITFFQRFPYTNLYDASLNAKDVLAWLEKQGKEDERYKYLKELFDADNIYQMAMNEAMVEEAKSKAINALSKLEISKLLSLEKQNIKKSAKIQEGRTYVCTETHKYGGVEWVKGEKYYSPENYSLVNDGCTYYSPNYSRERHNDLFEEVVAP